MVPGYVQGGTRVPPDQPEGGGRGSLYSECLWRRPELPSPKSKVPGQKRGLAQGKVVRWEATSSHPQAPLKPFTSHPQATHKPPTSHPQATHKPPSGSPQATRRLPQGSHQAPFKHPAKPSKATGHASKELDPAFLEVFALQQTDDGSGMGRGAVGCRIGGKGGKRVGFWGAKLGLEGSAKGGRRAIRRQLRGGSMLYQ
jgi:hypothetical protein